MWPHGQAPLRNSPYSGCLNSHSRPVSPPNSTSTGCWWGHGGKKIARPWTELGSWKVLPAGAVTAGPYPGLRYPAFKHQFPPKCQPVAGHSIGQPAVSRSVPRENTLWFRFGSENKHLEFYRFPRVGCCFPFQLLLNRPFHSEARGP